MRVEAHSEMVVEMMVVMMTVTIVEMIIMMVVIMMVILWVWSDAAGKHSHSETLRLRAVQSLASSGGMCSIRMPMPMRLSEVQ